MWPFLHDLIYDEATFFRALRLGLVTLSIALEAGWVPTFVHDGGKTIGPWVAVISALVSPRGKNGTPNGN